MLPLAVLLVWLALARGIKPLNQLEERIRARKPDDLSPLDDHAPCRWRWRRWCRRSTTC
jgi:two-component system sensor histidine kinase TctE